MPARNSQPRSLAVVLAVCCVAQFMVVLDASVVTVALPQIRSDLSMSTTSVQWVVNAYTLAFAGFLLLGGRASDLFGRRRVFVVGLTVFTAASLGGGLAQSGGWLVAARAVQGLGAAVLAPSTLSLLTTTFVEPDERRRAVGAWSASAASGVAVGVLVGGVLTQLLDWRWVLFVNVPIGTGLLGLTLVGIGETRGDAAGRPLDLPGAITVTAGLAVLVYGIVSTATRSWGSTATIATLAVAVLLLATAVVIEARFAAYPLVPLGIFRQRALALANIFAISYGAAIFAMYIFLSLFLQELDHDTPLVTGLAFLPAGLATTTGSLLAAGLAHRIGPSRQLALGPLLSAAGLAWLSRLSPEAGYAGHILAPTILAGFGFGITFVPLTIAATSDVAIEQAGLASGLINTSRYIGGSVGLAAMATIAASVARHHRALRAGTSAAAAGYDRAFAVAAIALLTGTALVALAARLGRRARTEAQSARDPSRSLKSENA